MRQPPRAPPQALSPALPDASPSPPLQPHTAYARSEHKLDKKYYQDGEHAYEMHCKLTRASVGLPELTDASVPLRRKAEETAAPGEPVAPVAAAAAAAATA